MNLSATFLASLPASAADNTQITCLPFFFFKKLGLKRDNFEMKADIILASSLAGAAAAACSCIVTVSSTVFAGFIELLSHHLPSAILPTDAETRVGDDDGDESSLCRGV